MPSLRSVILSLFSKELSGGNYRKYSIDSMRYLIKSKIKEANIPESDIHVIILNKKLDKCKNVEDMLKALTDESLGELPE